MNRNPDNDSALFWDMIKDSLRNMAIILSITLTALFAYHYTSIFIAEQFENPVIQLPAVTK